MYFLRIGVNRRAELVVSRRSALGFSYYVVGNLVDCLSQVKYVKASFICFGVDFSDSLRSTSCISRSRPVDMS